MAPGDCGDSMEPPGPEPTTAITIRINDMKYLPFLLLLALTSCTWFEFEADTKVVSCAVEEIIQNDMATKCKINPPSTCDKNRPQVKSVK